MASELHTYLEQLRSSLHLSPQVEGEVVRELHTHVEDRLAELRASGLSEEEAQRALLRRLDRPRVLARQFQQAYLPASWQDALTAAAAFLLVGALYAAHLWSQPLATLGVASAIVGVTLYGLWQGRPTWFYPWAGLALTLLSFFGYFAFVLLERAVRLMAEGHFDALTWLGFGGAALYFPLALTILASCILVASRRDWLDASLMLSPSAPVVVWLTVLHQNGGAREAGLSVVGADTALAATFLAMSVAVAIFVRVRTRSLRLATMFATAALVLLAVSSIYDPQLSLPALTGRALLLFGFLLSPAALEGVVARAIERAAPGD